MKLMAIDGNSIVNRAFYGVSQNLSTRDGLPTNAIFGFLNILLKLLEEEKPDGLAVTFDLKAPTFRHQAYEGYKAQRKGMPDELAAQMPVLKQVLDAMNIRRYELEGWEADDLLGTMSAVAEADGWDTVVVTGDKDSLQLIDEHVTVKLVSTRMGQTTTKDMTPEAFRAQYGFDPIHMIDLKALMGDTSDNIPGVKGIGEKTAMALMAQYPSIDELYAHLDGLDAKPAVLKKLEEGRDSARMSYDLATIHRDAPMGFRPEDTLRRPFNDSALYDLLLRLEFAKLIDKLGLSGHGAVEQKEDAFTGTCESEIVETKERVDELLRAFRSRDHVSFLALPELKGVCVEWGGEREGRAAVFLEDKLADYNGFLQGFFSPAVKKVTHDCKPLMGRLLEEGLGLEGFVFDTAIGAYLLSPTDGSYELDKLAVSYFNVEVPKAKLYQAPGAFAPMADLSQPLGAWMSHTALVEALYAEQRQKLAELDLERACYEIDLPLCAVLARMERAGFLVDGKALARFGEMLKQGIDQEEQIIYTLAGERFNILSPKQLGHILFDRLGLPPVKKTKTGYSTSAEVLEKLAPHHEIVAHILEYRQLTKLNSTYVEGLGKVIAPDGRVHTCFQNTVTATGRLSSTEPNLQNIPVRTPLGAEMRTMFVAPAGKLLVDADYSQIELRVLAHIAHDENMIKAFQDKEDIHTITASQVFDQPPMFVTPLMRSRAKAVNFGIVYGIGAFSLARDIGVSVAEADRYIQDYLRTYSGVKRYMDDIVAFGKEHGYVETMFHRRRYLPELAASNKNLQAFGKRVAMNTPIQGTAADIIKIAMVKAARRLEKEKLDARIILQVHDELIIEAAEKDVEAAKILLRQEMENAVQLKVPLSVDCGVGISWYDAK
mgnify:CR=1 FL=1